MPIIVTGVAETDRAFKQADRDLDRRLLKDDLKEAARPVVDSGREKIGHYRGAKTSSIRPRVTSRAVFVRQSAGKRTGKRPDFGSLQWRKLNEALQEKESEVIENLEEALDRLIDRAGL